MQKVGLYILVVLLSSGSLMAQSAKKKKRTAKDTINTQKFVPPVIVKDEEVVEDVPKEELMEVKIATIEQEGVKEVEEIAQGDATYRSTSGARQRTPFGKTGKYFLETVQIGSSYYDRKYGISDAKGTMLFPPVFNQINLQEDQTVSMQLGRVYGLYDENFKQILPFEYSSIQKLEGTDYYIISQTSNYYTKYLIDKTGKSLLPAEYNNLSVLYNAEVPNLDTKRKRYIKFYQSKINKYGIYDVVQKAVAAPAEYDEIYDTESGIMVKKNNVMNILDTQMKPVLAKWVTQISSTGKGCFLVTDQQLTGLCNRKGEFIAKQEYDKISYIYGSVPLFILQKQNKAGVIDERGKFIFPMLYQQIVTINEGLLLVKISGKWGVMNILGSEVLPAKYDTIMFNYSTLLLKSKNVQFYNLKSGTIVSEADYTAIERADENYKVSKNGKYGVLNAAFNLILPVEFDEIQSFYSREYMFMVKKNGKYGLYSNRGQMLIDPKYDRLITLGSGMGFMVKMGEKYGLLNHYGNEVAACEYDIIGTDYNDESVFICIKGADTKRVKMNKSY